MKKAYYARPISIDNTPQEARDHQLIRDLGFTPWPIGEDKQKVLVEYRKVGLAAFRPAVLASSALFFRAFPDGSIGAGVYQEIAWAREAGIPVIEFPRQVDRRALSVDATRAMLMELGQR